ncbi:uncharacterized protein [Palaemon carinicauda]|uniref:uncharacterized protein n=1 Tax=Palaemon carinicauda TaxID=392227 RepID=UPI0035B65339
MDSEVGTFIQPQRRFAHIHVNVSGPLPTSQGNHYLFTVIDRSTCRPETIPMETATCVLCTCALLSGWRARFGIPKHITSDRGLSVNWCIPKGYKFSMTHTSRYRGRESGKISRKKSNLNSCQ